MQWSYEELLYKVYRNGEERFNKRTGTVSRSVFGTRIEYDLRRDFPLLVTKDMSTNFRLIAEELFWFLDGDTDVHHLQDKGVHIWDEWMNEFGSIGPMYGAQWRAWFGCDDFGIDQLKDVIDGVKADPYSRRHVVSAWNVGELPCMSLAPCHVMFQFYVSSDNRLSVQVYQRSADMFLGVPFNIASYALLCRLVAHCTGLLPGKLVWVGGDTHIYEQHVEVVEQQLQRYAELVLSTKDVRLPELVISCDPKEYPWEYSTACLDLCNYVPGPKLKAEVVV